MGQTWSRSCSPAGGAAGPGHITGHGHRVATGHTSRHQAPPSQHLIPVYRDWMGAVPGPKAQSQCGKLRRGGGQCQTPGTQLWCKEGWGRGGRGCWTHVTQSWHEGDRKWQCCPPDLDLNPGIRKWERAVLDPQDPILGDRRGRCWALETQSQHTRGSAGPPGPNPSMWGAGGGSANRHTTTLGAWAQPHSLAQATIQAVATRLQHPPATNADTVPALGALLCSQLARR